MLGFGGHFLTKDRHFSVTFQLLRDTRVSYRRHEDQVHAHPAAASQPAQVDEDTFARKADADRFLAQVEADIVRGQYVDPSDARLGGAHPPGRR